MNKFEELSISEASLKGIQDMGFTEMSQIQEKSIPVLLDGHDIIGQSQTGTGKTASFGIPLIERVDSSLNIVQAIVLCPTRELTMQVSREIGKLGKYVNNLRVLSIYGGESINKQIKELRKGPQIVVGTPGRVIDLIKRNKLNLDAVHMVVLDEADEMFDMGFRDDMEFVLSHTSPSRQTVFFSATMDKQIKDFSKRYQDNPTIIKVVQNKLTVPNVSQYYYNVKSRDKAELLMRLIELNEPKLSVVFCNTKKQVDNLVGELTHMGYFVDGIHGDLTQDKRDRVMKRFRKGDISILVATDVLARGIDVDDIDAVFNFDLPQDPEYYVHRIGRTARAGRYGSAYSLVTRGESRRLKDIERYTKTKITRLEIPTESDMERKKLKKFQKEVFKTMEDDDLDQYKDALESVFSEDYDDYTLALALVKMILRAEDKEIGAIEQQPIVGEVGRIHLSIGKKMGIGPKNVLAGIIEHTSLNKDSIGKIDIFDTFSFVEIPESQLERTLSELDGRSIGGRRVRAERAKARKN